MGLQRILSFAFWCFGAAMASGCVTMQIPAKVVPQYVGLGRQDRSHEILKGFTTDGFLVLQDESNTIYVVDARDGSIVRRHKGLGMIKRWERESSVFSGGWLLTIDRGFTQKIDIPTGTVLKQYSYESDPRYDSASDSVWRETPYGRCNSPSIVFESPNFIVQQCFKYEHQPQFRILYETVHVSAKDGRLLYQRPFAGKVLGIAPDEKTIIAGLFSSQEKEKQCCRFQSWNLSNGIVANEIDPGMYGAVFADEHIFGIVGKLDTRVHVRIYDITSLREMRRFAFNPSSSNHMAVSKDGKLSVASRAGVAASIMRIPDGSLVSQLQGSSDEPAFAMIFSDDARRVFGLSTGIIKVWEVASGRLIHKVKTNLPAFPLDIQLSADEKRIYYQDQYGALHADEDKRILNAVGFCGSVDVLNGERKLCARQGHGYLRRDGRTYVSSLRPGAEHIEKGKFFFFDLFDNFREIGRIDYPTLEFGEPSYYYGRPSHKGTYIAEIREDGTPTLRDTRSGTVVKTLERVRDLCKHEAACTDYRKIWPLDATAYLRTDSEEQYLLLHSSERIWVWSIRSGRFLYTLRLPYHRFERTTAGISSNGTFLMTSDFSGSVDFYNLSSGTYLYSVIQSGQTQLILSKSTGYYKISKENDAIFNELKYILDMKAFSIENFDLAMNRPDKIYSLYHEATGDQNYLDRAQRAKSLFHARLAQNGFRAERMHNWENAGFSQVIISQSILDKAIALESNFNLPITLLGSGSTIVGYKLFVNGVPISGDYVKHTYPGTSNLIKGEEVSIHETIQLSSGPNRIEASAFTEGGVESPRVSFTVKYDPPSKYKPELYFVGIGIDSYNASANGGLDALKYAVKDSKELEETFKKAGGNFTKVHTKVLANAEVTRESIGKLKEFLSKSRVDDHVILFLSGHGIRKDTKVGDLITAFGENVPPQYKLRSKGDVDDVYYYMTSDANVEKPWEKAVPLDAIREIVNGIPSRQKIMLVDTCQSGEKLDLDDATVASLTKNIEIRKTRGKTAQTRGVKLVTTPGTKEKPEEVEKKIVQTIAKTNALKEMSELFPELRRGTGTIEISAATGAQSALESSEWKNGAFTFVIKEAILKGKAKDSKGNITARSLRKFVLEEVERLTDGQQTPMVARDIAGRDFIIFGK